MDDPESAWDAFGEDGDTDMDDELNVDNLVLNAIFVQLMSSSPASARTIYLPNENNEIERGLQMKVFITATSDQFLESLKSRLSIAKFSDVTSSCDADGTLDIVLDADTEGELGIRAQKHYDKLVPGGLLIATCRDNKLDMDSVFPFNQWRPVIASVDVSSKSEQLTLLVLRRNAIRCNELALPWKPASITGLKKEYELLDNSTVPLSTAERKVGRLSVHSHAKAVEALSKFGVCFLLGIFSSDDVMRWGECALDDLKLCMEVLEDKGINLLTPGIGSECMNYYELAMREDLRCDIRHCKNMKTAAAELEDLEKSLLSTEPLSKPNSNNSHGIRHDVDSTLNGKLMRRHPSVMAILNETMNPRGEHYDGNWGRWNFEGGGPDMPKHITAGDVGAVMSLPGCGDQAIHADIYHLYDHVQLPPHYVNMFLPAAREDSADIKVGQTAFIPGSHYLENSARWIARAKDRGELYSNIIRPHVNAGDAMLFDTRILHFGMANKHETSRRPVCYVNYTQAWFEDKKNWRKEKLFNHESTHATTSS